MNAPVNRCDWKYWIDAEGKVQRTTDLLAWAQWMGSPNRLVAMSKVGDHSISTVLLGLDQYWGDDPNHPPILFETMVFGPKHEVWMDRYCTKEQAEAGHRLVVERMIAGLPPGKDE